jgi:hypothetical protein
MNAHLQKLKFAVVFALLGALPALADTNKMPPGVLPMPANQAPLMAAPGGATPAPAGAASPSAMKHLPPAGISFAAGTLVMTKHGKKAIENIKAGDMVWATDPQTRQSGYHQVDRVVAEKSNQLVDVLTDSREKIEAAPVSLFWVNTKSWVAAQSLFPGDQLLQRNGTFTRVFNVIPRLGSVTPVYNVELEGFHTYYVGKLGLLVRNQFPQE